MAILKLGELVAGIRGTIGGTIYSQNKSGPFARRWSRGTDPQTPDQTVQRATMASHSFYWLQLTQGQRDDWDTYAADPAQEKTNSLGQAYYTSGWNWFCAINNNLTLSERARRPTFPDCPTPIPPTITEAICYTPIALDFHCRITYPQYEFSDHDVIVHIALYSRISLISKSRGFRGVHYTTPTTTTWTQFGLTTLDKFGQPPNNGKAFLRIQKQHEQGRRSAVVTMTADVISL